MARSANGRGDVLSLHLVENIVIENRKELKAATLRSRKDVRSYLSEFYIFLSIIKEHLDVLRAKFRRNSGVDLVVVGKVEAPKTTGDDAPEEGSIGAMKDGL